MSFFSDDPHRYDDMLELPHPVSKEHPRMSLYDRAAQFAPFKALTGYEDDVSEEARLTDQRIDLDENRIERLDARLQLIADHLAESPEIAITWFQPDMRKSGGAYRTVMGRVKNVDPTDHTLSLYDGTRIPIEDIYNLEGSLFSSVSGLEW